MKRAFSLLEDTRLRSSVTSALVFITVLTNMSVGEVIIDFTSVGVGPFNHAHFESVGILFTVSSESVGFIQGDEALISDLGGQIAADIPGGFSDISVSGAAGFQGSWEFTLTAFDNLGGVVGQTFINFEETGSTGYHVLSLSDLSGAVSFEITGIQDGAPSGFGYGVNVIRFTPPPIVEVDIDIKPDSDQNSVNPRSKGVIPVAILTTDDFDATAVDPMSVEFGPDGATEAHGNGHIEDADGDGDLDLVLHFKTQDTGIQCGDTDASLTGETFGGQMFEGTDSINTVGCR